jgi:hypothetical protein
VPETLNVAETVGKVVVAIVPPANDVWGVDDEPPIDDVFRVDEMTPCPPDGTPLVLAEIVPPAPESVELSLGLHATAKPSINGNARGRLNTMSVLLIR